MVLENKNKYRDIKGGVVDVKAYYCIHKIIKGFIRSQVEVLLIAERKCYNYYQLIIVKMNLWLNLERV